MHGGTSKKRVKGTAGDARNFLVQVLETVEEEVEEAHRGGTLGPVRRRSKKKEDVSNEEELGEIELALSFGDIVRSSKVEEEIENGGEDFLLPPMYDNLSVCTKLDVQRGKILAVNCVLAQSAPSVETRSFETERCYLLEMPTIVIGADGRGSCDVPKSSLLEVLLRDYFKEKIVKRRCDTRGADACK